MEARLTTFEWTGRPVDTRVRLEASGERVYVRAGGAPDWVVRLWNNPTVWIAPCTRSGRVVGEPRPSRARVVPRGDDGDELWIELAPTHDNGRPI
jgi:PPOX class probable F420-dependent enzyme